MSGVNFKVGDKVRVLNADESNDEKSRYIKGEIVIVISVGTGWLTTRNSRGGENGWSHDNFELVEETTSELEQLIKKANDGFGAARSIRDLYPSNVEVLFDDGRIYYHNDWHKVARLPEWTIRPRTKFIPFTVGNGWKVNLVGEVVGVGCQTFFANILLSYLKDLTQNSFGGMEGFSACRLGVSYKGNLISWDDADKIVAELQKAGVK